MVMIGSQGAAQPVAVQSGEIGQGFAFSREGTCYAVLPRHVAGGAYRAQLVGRDGQSARASIRMPFWNGMDLALAVLTRGGALCEATLDDLDGPRSSIARKAAVLVLVGLDGTMERLPMEITTIRYLDLEARFSGASSVEARQGMSGGFLLVDGDPVGMAIDTIGGDTVRFMRVEEIHMNLSRLLATEAAFGVTAPAVNDVDDAPIPEGHALELSHASALASGPDTLPENILGGDAPYVFAPSGPATIELTLTNATSLSQLTLRSSPEGGEAMPRRVLVQVNSKSEGGRWRTFWSGEMPPNGLLDTGQRLATSARRIRVTISSAWSQGLVRIDRVIVK